MAMNIGELTDELDDTLNAELGALDPGATQAEIRLALAAAIASAVITHIQNNATTSDDGESIE